MISGVMPASAPPAITASTSPEREKTVGLEQGVVAACARQRRGRGRPRDAEFDRDQAGHGVRHDVRDQERVRLLRSPGDESPRAALHAAQTAAAGVEGDAVAVGRGGIDGKVRVGHRLLGGSDREVGGAGEPARRLVLQPLPGLEVAHFAGDPDLEVLGVERGDRAGARGAGLHPAPERVDVVADGSHGAESGDHDPAVVPRGRRVRRAHGARIARGRRRGRRALVATRTSTAGCQAAAPGLTRSA